MSVEMTAEEVAIMIRARQIFREKGRLFEWLDEYRRNIIIAGLASSGSRRRYWEGLRSANIDRRNRALRSAVRWLIEM